MKTKVQLIQHLINTKNFNSYLEIGVRGRKTFDNIICKQKVGIDPILVGDSNQGKEIFLYKQDSDTFFKMNKFKFDIVFIDGLHLYEQVIKDTVNSWNCLNLNGAIVIHDCLPSNPTMASRKRTTRQWCGDVWKSIVWFRESYPKIYCRVINIDYGCGLIIKSNDEMLSMPHGQNKYMDLGFDWLQSNLNLLNITTEI